MPVFLLEVRYLRYEDAFRPGSSSQGDVIGAYNTREKAHAQLNCLLAEEGAFNIKRENGYGSRGITDVFEYKSEWGYIACVYISSIEVNKPISAWFL